MTKNQKMALDDEVSQRAAHSSCQDQETHLQSKAWANTPPSTGPTATRNQERFSHEPPGERRITPKQLTRGTKHRPCRKDTQVARSFLPRRDIRHAARTNRNDRTPPCGLYTPQKHEQPERRGRGQGESDTGADVQG